MENNVVSLEILRHLRALKNFANRCQPLNKTALYEHLYEDGKYTDEVVLEILKSLTHGVYLFTPLYISLPQCVYVVELMVPIRGRLRSFQGMERRGAMIEALYWLLISQRALLATA